MDHPRPWRRACAPCLGRRGWRAGTPTGTPGWRARCGPTVPSVGRARARPAASDRGRDRRRWVDAPRGPRRVDDARGSLRPPAGADGARRRVAVRGFVALLRKELRVYFGSPLVYLVAAVFLAYAGYYFHSDL